MLDAYIIERTRKKDQKSQQERPCLRIGEHKPQYPTHNDRDTEKQTHRGIAVIDFTI